MLYSLQIVLHRLIISVVLVFSVYMTSSVAHASPLPCSAPKLNLISLDGKKVPLQQYSGKILIVAFWTTWCSLCRTSELPGLAALRKQIPSADLMILAISNDAEKQEVKRYLEYPGIDFGDIEHNVFFDPKYIAYHAIIGQNVAEVHPYAVIFDQKGCTVGMFVGAHNWLSTPTMDLINELLNKD